MSILAASVLSACSAGSPAATASPAPAVDTTCVEGTAFQSAYQPIASRFDPQVDSDRQRLAAAPGPDSARPVLLDLAGVLQRYDAELAPLRAPPDFGDSLATLLAADGALRQAALALAAGGFGPADQSAFQRVAGDRQAALHDLRLQVAFVSSECG